MDTITSWALTSMAVFGGPILIFISFFGSLGIPFPITAVIVAAGALTRTGTLDWHVALLASLAGAALADNSEFLLGRLAQPWLKQRFEQKPAWHQAMTTLNRQGSWAILLTRFWLTPLAPAINVIAGSRYPFLQFLIFDLVGQLFWVVLYGGLGYLFAAQWQWVSKAIGVFSWLSLALVLLAYCVYFLLHRKFQKAS